MPKIAHGAVPIGAPPASVELTRSGSGGRDRAIDVLRGLCIISMTTAHLAAGSWPWQIFHIGTFVDGAVGFVFLSGLVVGMTQRRVIERGGMLAGQRKLLRRSVLIYVANLCLCLVAFATTAADASRAATYPGIDALGGPLRAAAAALTLRYSPHYTSILSLYVVLLLVSIAAVWALSCRRAWIVAAGSVLLYVAGYVWPEAFTFPVRPGVIGPVNWATWQLLFMTALLVGWYWRRAPVRRMIVSRPLVYSASVVVLALSFVGWIVTHGAPADWWRTVSVAFTEGTLGPATIVMAFAAVLVGYRVCRLLVRLSPAAVSPIGLIGRRSLDCYLILSVVVIVLPSVYSYPPGGLVSVGVAFDVLALMVLWCLLRDWLGRGGLGRGGLGRGGLGRGGPRRARRRSRLAEHPAA